MKTVFSYVPQNPDVTLYGRLPSFVVNIHSQEQFEVPAYGTVVVETSPMDYKIVSNMNIPGLTWSLVENDETTAGDWGTVFCDAVGCGTQEYLKGSQADFDAVVDGQLTHLDEGSTFLTLDTGKMYVLGNDMNWHLVS